MANYNNNQFIHVIKSNSTKTTNTTFKHKQILYKYVIQAQEIQTTNMEMKNMDPIHKYSKEISRFTSLSSNKRLSYHIHVPQHMIIKLNINHGNNKR